MTGAEALISFVKAGRRAGQMRQWQGTGVVAKAGEVMTEWEGENGAWEYGKREKVCRNHMRGSSVVAVLVKYQRK